MTGHDPRGIDQGLDDIRQGLRMAGAPDAEALAAQTAELEALESAPATTRWWAYFKRGGPGYLQAAMTLGGGTAISAVFAGRMFGYQLLWVAPVAMLLGILMLGALGHQTLSTGARPFEAMKRFAGAPLAWGWALGALVASIIWHFPQYALAGAAISDLGEVLFGTAAPAIETAVEDPEAAVPPVIAPQVGAFGVLAVAVLMSFLYGTNDRLVRLYENGVKLLVWGIVVAFGAVVVATAGDTDWGAVAQGFIPSIPDEKGGVAGFTLVVSGLAAAVGINMVFLYPYSLLARGWGRAHRPLARFDLVMGMLVPYALATSLVIIATANAIPWTEASGGATNLAPVEAAQALGTVVGDTAGRLVFDLGLIGMALSTITLHMLCSGFVIMELTGARFGSQAWRVGTLLPAVGVLGPTLWQDLLWIAVPTNVVCGLFLPLAYIGLIRLQRNRDYLGDDRPSGAVGAAWLLGMIAVTAFLTYMFGRYVVANVL